MKPHPSPPCVVAPSDQPHTSFLHVAGLSRDDKTKWITAANLAGLPLAEWVQRGLNRAADQELERNPVRPDAAPPVV